MKKTTFFSLLAMMLLFVSGNVWADTYSHTFADGQVTDNGTVTLSEVDWTLTMDGGKVSAFDASKGAHFGTNNATCNSVTLSTDGISGTISSITVEASRGANLQGTLAVTVGDEEFTTTGETSLTTDNTAYEFVGAAAGGVAIVWTKTGGKGAFYINKITIEYSTGGSSVVVTKPVINPNGGTFAEAQEVTITSEGNTIYYTLDGTDPTNESTQYKEPFVVETACTVKAIAYDDDDNASNIASAEFKFLTPITSIAELCAAATSAKEPALVEFNNWICTGVAGANAYFTDGKNGVLLYQSGHGFELNDVLTGTAQLTLTLYNDCAEIIGLTSTTEGVIVTKGEGATPMQVIISDLEKDMQGNVITLEGVTYNADGKVFVDDDDNEIIPYNKFITLPTLLDGKTYNVTGVAIWYKSKGKWEIAPRTEEEFQLLTSQIAPVSAWSVEHENVDFGEESTAIFTTDSDGDVTYSSSDEEVATIDAEGNITIVGLGTTIITAVVAETETYLTDSKSFTLVVNEKGYAEIVFAYNDEDIWGQGAANTGAEFSATRDNMVTLYFNKAYANPSSTNDHIKIYGSKYETQGEGEDAEKVLTEPSYIQLSIVEGYAINKIVITATTDGYIKEWVDQDGKAAVIEGATATWEGIESTVTLTNQATSQARIKTIAVTYINSDVITAISTPTTVKENGAIYNLAGQRLQKMQKGINIIGGKKVVLK